MTQTETATVKEAVRAALADWLAAFNHKNADDFYRLYDPEIVYANEHAPLKLYRRAADGRWLLTFDMDNTPPDAADYR